MSQSPNIILAQSHKCAEDTFLSPAGGSNRRSGVENLTIEVIIWLNILTLFIFRTIVAQSKRIPEKIDNLLFKTNKYKYSKFKVILHFLSGAIFSKIKIRR